MLHITSNDENKLVYLYHDIIVINYVTISTRSPEIVNIKLTSNTAYGKFELSPDEKVDHTYESLENYENVGLQDNAPQEVNGDTSNQPPAVNVN